MLIDCYSVICLKLFMCCYFLRLIPEYTMYGTIEQFFYNYKVQKNGNKEMSDGNSLNYVFLLQITFKFADCNSNNCV